MCLFSSVRTMPGWTAYTVTPVSVQYTVHIQSLYLYHAIERSLLIGQKEVTVQ